VPTPLTTRRATTDDLDVLIADVQAGFDSYVAFAPKGWMPPNMHLDSHLTAELLADPSTWALIADADGQAAGHIAFFPARERTEWAAPGDWRSRPLMRGVAHLWQLFVLPDWWGRGIAPMLHEAATAEMEAQGYERSRLYTPALHARARHFYERRGWAAGEESWNQYLELPLVEYWLELGD
jgi:GNAT superfamily N-acetyltransferase